MAGISSCGVHIPRTRLPLNLITGSAGGRANAERTIAAFDEDAITMAVSAAARCLGDRDRDRERVDHLYLATTSPVFIEKSSAAIVARALNLRDDILTVDYGASLRAPAAALHAAVDAVSAGPTRSVLVIASDARPAEPYSAQELQFGDAAVAFLVTPDGGVRLVADHAVNQPLFDVWREDGAPTIRTWEDRFVVEHGLNDAVEAAVGGFMARHKCAPDGFDALACYAPDARSHPALVRRLGFTREQSVAPLFGRVGNCGSALVPLLLVQALETARGGEQLLTAFYGDGAHVMSWQVDRPTAPVGLERQLGLRVEAADYRSYLQGRGRDVNTPPVSRADGISATVSFRDADADIGFIGARCRHCGTEQYPPARVCYGCAGKDCFEPIPLATRRGTIASFTKDYFFPSPNPPTVAGMCEVDGGARVYLQMADYGAEELATGMPVEFVFRRIHSAGGKPAYFWKSRLLAGEQTQEPGGE